MNDFLKLVTYNQSEIEHFSSHSLLNWVSETDHINNFDNEVITTKKVKQYKGIYFCFYSNKLEILFKPHYYFKDNIHNADDFSIIDCLNIIKEVRDTLKINLQAFKIVNIEYGVNCLSPIDVKDLITYFAYHERNEFRTDTGLPYSKKSYSVNAKGIANKHKIIKAYAKGVQFPCYCDKNTFRFEIKSKKSRFINQLGIYNADDLLNPAVYVKFQESIITEFEKVLILDCSTDFKNLSLKEQTKIAKYNNPMEWYRIKNLPNRNSFSNHKKKYYNLVNKVPSNLKNQLQQIIIEKLETLKKGAISPPYEISKKGAISPLYNRGICTLKENKVEVKKRVCKVTGLNIEMQKDNSVLLSHTGLKYYYNTDRKIFEQLKRRYLSKQWFNSDFQKQIKEIAHNIRNTKSNQTIKQKRIYNPSQLNILHSLGFRTNPRV